MTIDQEIKDVIVNIVEVNQGLKLVDLVCRITAYVCDNMSPKDVNVPDVIEQLIESGELLEIEYVLPQIDYRIKSFILPGKTEVKLNKTLRARLID